MGFRQTTHPLILNPLPDDPATNHWIPAYAGMTVIGRHHSIRSS